LDDPNTERLCRLVKEMSTATQFVFITHNKIAMELAEHLVGVTMQEQGVSRLVAVDLGPILSDADAALKDVMTRAGVAA
jgi:chromosome segregation protein